MNGNENFYAAAFFCALTSLGSLLKLDAATGLTMGSACALAGAVFLRLALIKSAQAAEEDHQRMEIQLQQLRTKIIETSAATIEAMTSVNTAAALVQENIPIIRVRLAELDSLSKLLETAETISATLTTLDKNFSALNAGLEKISAAVSEQNNSSPVVEELQKLTAAVEVNKSELQTILKLLQLIGQLLKNQPYAKDLSKIGASLDKLNKISADAAQSKQSALTEQDLALLKKIAAKINV